MGIADIKKSIAINQRFVLDYLFLAGFRVGLVAVHNNVFSVTTKLQKYLDFQLNQQSIL